MKGNSLGSRCHFTGRQKQVRERHVEGEDSAWRLEPAGGGAKTVRNVSSAEERCGMRSYMSEM